MVGHAREIDRRFGERMRTERERQGMSQQVIASNLRASYGIQWHQSTMTKVEAGTRPVRLFESVAVAAVLGVTMKDLLDEPRPKRSSELLCGRMVELSYMQDQLQARYDRIAAGERDD